MRKYVKYLGSLTASSNKCSGSVSYFIMCSEYIRSGQQRIPCFILYLLSSSRQVSLNTHARQPRITVGTLAGEDKGSVIQLGEGWLGMNLAYYCYPYMLPLDMVIWRGKEWRDAGQGKMLTP